MSHASVPPTGADSLAVRRGRDAALIAFRRAAAASSGYRRWLERQGVVPDVVDAIDEVPYLVKRDVFGGPVNDWIVGGRPSLAAEVLTSSGRGGAFSIGLTSRAELRALEATIDGALRAVGATDTGATLLLNCLPMGIGTPTSVATVATPSVHLEMAQELFERIGPDFDRIVVVAEPVFMKELAERIAAARGGGRRVPTSCIVGGEWVSESWRAYVSGLFGMPPASDMDDSGIMISMGAAELGLNLLFETPALRALRSRLDGAGRGGTPTAHDMGYTPSLFAFNPERFFVEERSHGDRATTLAFTSLGDGLLPLVRYDLGDVAEFVAPSAINDALSTAGIEARVTEPVVAFWGRQSDGIRVGLATIRPEHVKQRLFADAAVASQITGRFYIESTGGPTLHVQRRATAGSSAALRGAIATMIDELTQTPCAVMLHSHDAYPFHVAGDFQHKPVYHGRT